jgi:hypothetical protein
MARGHQLRVRVNATKIAVCVAIVMAKGGRIRKQLHPRVKRTLIENTAKVCVMPPPKARHVFEFGFPEVANPTGEHFARRQPLAYH